MVRQFLNQHSCGLEGGRGFVGEDAGEVGAVAVDQNDFEHSGEEAWSDAGAACQGDVEDQDVDEDGAEDAEAQGGGASDEDEQAAEDLEEGDVVHPARGDHDTHEVFDGGAGWRRRRGHEGMQAVGAEDDEHEAEQDAADQVEIFHGGRDSLREVVERGSRTQ